MDGSVSRPTLSVKLPAVADRLSLLARWHVFDRIERALTIAWLLSAIVCAVLYLDLPHIAVWLGIVVGLLTIPVIAIWWEARDAWDRD